MKLGNLYNLAAFDLLQEQGRRGFGDAAGSAGVVLARNLTGIDPQIFRKQYPDLTFMNSGVQVDNSGGFVLNIQSLRVVEQGAFRNAGDSSGNKGHISVRGEDNTIAVTEREADAVWTESEIQTASLQGINLVTEHVTAFDKIYKRELDEIGYLGNPDKTGSVGLLNLTDFTVDAATDVLANLNAQQLYDNIAGLITDQWNAVNNTPGYMANRVDLPVPVFNDMSRRILNTAAGERTVLQALRTNFPEVEFRVTFRANDAGAGGVSRVVAYSNSPEVMKLRVPVPLTMSEILKQGRKYSTDAMYRIAGLDLLETSGGRYLDGL